MTQRTRILVVAAAGAAATAAAIGLDGWAYGALARPRVYDSDFGRLLRVMGFVPTWLLAALGVWLHDRRAGTGGRRAAELALAPIVTGALAEGLKLLARRERPGDVLGPYVFRPFDDRPWSTAGLGLPSSHALVAFGAAVALSRLFPTGRWLWFALAAGCAWSRVAAHAHWLSDVVAAAAVALVAAAIWAPTTSAEADARP